MLTAQENELLTRTGPGTPGGALLRRYWQPIALSEELPADGPPQPVTVMGEELVLFRDDRGRVGLLGINCAHRCADLSYGRIEDGGLRCLYHGWLYDIEGRCLEQPAEPADSTYKDEIRHIAYPCREVGNLIFAYMGPGDEPVFPDYEALRVPDAHRFVAKTIIDCNYLQALEGDIDPAHLSYLHSTVKPPDSRAVRGSNRSADFFYGSDRRPTLEIELADFGVRIFSIRDAGDGKKYVRVTNFIMPNKAAIVGNEGRINQGHQINWHVPIDDGSHLRFDITMNREKPIDTSRYIEGPKGEVTADKRLVRNRANRYLQDRDEMSRTFTGMGGYFMVHDAFASETQGAVHDRTREHLGTTDKFIAAARRQILDGIAAVEAGKDPLHTIRSEDDNDLSQIVVLSEVVPNEEDHKTLWRKYASARRAG
jgi:phenylpropionate dioxygenase-like ring-hydroxylating dioxygenase large terminal subunit